MKVTFNINFHTVWGQKLCIVGSIPELGSWEPALAKEMNYAGDGNWQLELEITSPVEQIEYRYFLSSNDEQIFEEWERNHQVFFIGSATRYTLYDYWQIRPVNLAFYSSAFTKSLFAHPCNTYERAVKSGKRLTIKISVPRVEKNQSVAITGNQDCLGNWHPDKALILSCDTFPVWHIDLDANEITYPLEYKFLIYDDKRQPLYWEEDENRFLNLPQQSVGETVIVSGLYFRDNLPFWRCTGSVIPVFSLRSEQSFGVGDLGDLQLLVDWAKKTNQRIIQVLPMNDTTMTHTWVDSYPYSAISIYALHPMYINLPLLGVLKDKERAAFFAAKQVELNAKDTVDYEEVVKYKLAYCREFFKQEGAAVLDSQGFKEFLLQNETWLLPYAAYCYLRDMYGTSDFTKWKDYSVFDKSRVRKLCTGNGKAYPDISFSYFLQYMLHTQFKSVSDYARKNGIVLKGDLPIGVSRTSIEAWTEPQYFNMNGQAGAPPDDFSVNGQNWMFPTYNWDAMEKDNFIWWKNRFRKLSDYFDCFRIDHILGFFRIWEVPMDYVQGLCGHFNPALPFTEEEIEQYGLIFNEARLTTPHINREFLPELFGEQVEMVIGTYLAQSSSNHFVLKPFCDTQRKIEALFAGKTDEGSIRIKEGLFAIANEVLFLRDSRNPDKFHPRISANQSYLYRELSTTDRYAFDQLYWHFFYHRHNDFWKAQAFKRLTPLVGSTDMLVCGEDLGMIPDSVPDVMNKLQIFSLEIERMPKTAQREFTDLLNLPYHSVCTTSTHDMSPLRSWWKEDYARTQRYYNQVLGRQGEATEECTSDIATQIVSNHLNTHSMLAIIPLQDWFAMDDSIKRKDASAERINIPSHPNHYWRYRMHITLEELLRADNLNNKIIALIEKSGRK
ncbi:4-alpha-glucanotransferase [Parabacteroides sp. AM08-6]|uniref:4-alpha-glucanotransferase n=1 Tax=Parabacteroides sp. AM08-6 TaxID=2292053 RepID=UPI000EFE35EE|nr:4-alpha-glucanotransferase [Parabacteroides sp. AM08-6]RHJ84323.1 4-alpha-glucanotransferase [Parabacteroides sp. AM08-6]